MKRVLIGFLCILTLALCYLVTSPTQAAFRVQRSREAAGLIHFIPPDPGSEKWARLANFSRAAPFDAASLQSGANEGNEGTGGIGGSVLNFFQRMGDSSWSTGLHESRYAYDLIESVHVWALCLFFGLAVMFDFRLLGWTMKNVPVSEVARRLLPWTAVGFGVMVISGTLLFSAIPLRSYQNIFFRAKMTMLLLAGLNVWIFHSGVYRRVTTWDVDSVTPKAARVAGALSLILWVCIVLSGRMIAYNWFDCDRQPQPAIINFLTSCVPTQAEH
jgi:Family of unknown function (DUF6644)